MEKNAAGDRPEHSIPLPLLRNASGTIACFNLDGDRQWIANTMAVGRSQPFLQDDGTIVFTRQANMPDEHGHFTHEHKNAPVDQWTQLHAIDIPTGEVKWTSRCGVRSRASYTRQRAPCDCRWAWWRAFSSRESRRRLSDRRNGWKHHLDTSAQRIHEHDDFYGRFSHAIREIICIESH